MLPNQGCNQPGTIPCRALDPVVFPDLDNARLKRSFEYYGEHYVPAELVTPGLDAVNLSERDESLRISPAKRALAVAIADFVEGTGFLQ